MKKGFLALALGGLGLLVMGSSVRADSVVLSLVGSPVASGSDWKYTYDVMLDQNNLLKTNDFGTLFDIQGYVAGSATAGTLPGTFTESEALLTTLPLGSSPTIDSPGLVNVQWTYSGADISSAGGDVDLGTFTLLSTISTHGFVSFYGGADHSLTGVPQGNQGLADAPNAAPLPSAAWGGLGLLGMLAGGQYIRRRQMA